VDAVLQEAAVLLDGVLLVDEVCDVDGLVQGFGPELGLAALVARDARAWVALARLVRRLVALRGGRLPHRRLVPRLVLLLHFIY